MSQKLERIGELESLIKKHQDLYYNKKTEISDAEFDALWDELKSIDPGNPVLEALGADSQDGFLKTRHILPMGSQEKASTPDEFMAWTAKVRHPEYITQFKMDGASLELQYEEGILKLAVTRGDGIMGDDISKNAFRMQGAVKVLPFKWSGAVRCEVVMRKSTLAEHFPDMANPRNAANGIMKRKDGSGSEMLELICYDCAPLGIYDDDPAQKSMSLFPSRPESPFDDEMKKLEWLRLAGFTAVETKVFTDPWEVIDYRAAISAKREELPFEIDGLVIKGRLVDIEDMKRNRPEKQIAFKFPPEEAIATLLEIEWSESGANYTPVGILSPVRLAGTIVKRANLANTNTIFGMGLRIGSRVLVAKRGEIIPKIEGLVDSPADSIPIEVPEICLSCNTALIDEGTRLYCPNPDCPKKAFHRLEKWISVLDIQEMGTAILSRLFETARVRQIADIYTLTADELSLMERMGEKSAEKLVNNIKKTFEISLPAFVAGFDIEGMGQVMVEKAVEAGFDSIEKLRSATVEELSVVPGFGQISADALLTGMKQLKDEMDAVLDGGGIRIKGQEGGPLKGLSFCFTGQMESMKRQEAENLVKSLGGSVKSNVVSGLSYLVTNEPGSGSAKNRKAVEQGVRIISEKEFLELTGGQA